MSRHSLFNAIRLMSMGRHPDKRPKARLLQATVADLMTADPVIATPDMTLSHIVNQVFLRRWVSFLPVVEDGVILGTIDSHVLAGLDREHWNNTTVNDVFVIPDWNRLLTASTPVSSALDLIDQTGQRKFLVAEDRHLLGILTLADLSRAWVQFRIHNQKGAFH